MKGTETTVILASGSPRRKEILRNAGIAFEVMVTGADENMEGDMSPLEFARAISRRKAEAAVKTFHENGRNRAVIIAADTIVHIGGRILGKPAGRDEAFEFIRLLADNWHDVYTGVTVAFVNGGNVEYTQDCRRTGVKFKPLTDEVIMEYIDTGEPFDTAGAYAIQGHGEKLVERIDGEYDNVVGLPLDCLVKILEHPPAGF